MKKILSGFLIMTFVINIFGVTALFAAPIENQTNNDSITLIRAFDTNDNTKIIADNNEITVSNHLKR